MAAPGARARTPPRPVFSGGPCPGGEEGGALLILRRRGDGRLLFHCPRCGLSFTHEADGADPEAGRNLKEVAPRGAAPATVEEIRAAGLAEHARPWSRGTVRKPAPPPPPPRPVSTTGAHRPVSVHRFRSEARGKGKGNAKLWLILVYAAIYILLQLLSGSWRD